MISECRVRELLDYATCYGEFNEDTPYGTQCAQGESFATPMSQGRRSAIIAYKKVLGLLPDDYQRTEPKKCK